MTSSNEAARKDTVRITVIILLVAGVTGWIGISTGMWWSKVSAQITAAATAQQEIDRLNTELRLTRESLQSCQNTHRPISPRPGSPIGSPAGAAPVGATDTGK